MSCCAADLNGAVLEAFGAAGEHLETTLGLDGVRERLRAVGWITDVGGEHVVECYVVKDGVVVARDRIDVPVSNTSVKTANVS
ncbi:nucleotide-binding domain-containing protein [Streptomyces diastaticus]|uniref:nucleotide-binding domain-containing protein n=1 Tax=Streptomyces TaxID=1883 RepID=UPI0026C103BC